MSDTENSLVRGGMVVLLTMAVLAVGSVAVSGIGRMLGKETYANQPGVVSVVQAGMVPAPHGSEAPAFALSDSDFQALVSCVYELSSTKEEVIVPGSQSGGRHQTFFRPLLYNIELQLVDEEDQRIVGGFVYRRTGEKKGWLYHTYPHDGELTDQQFVKAAYVMLNGPCVARSVAESR